MGDRITWRSRPRSDYPWPLRTRKITIGEIPTFAADGYVWIGPLPMAAVCELVYRVTKIEMVASTVLETEDDPISFSLTETVAHAATKTEIEVFQENAYDQTIGQVFGTPLISSAAEVHPIFTNKTGSEPDLFKDIEVLDTQDGNFYLCGGFGVTLSGGGGEVVTAGELDTGGSYEEFVAQLFLNSGTFEIPAIATSIFGQPTSSSIVMTATEWFPYKTTAGAAAWNTATGAPVNGGPGE